MKHPLTMIAMSLSLVAAAQAQEAADEQTPASGTQETEVSEDNYRRFMELKDARIERDAFPTNAFTPQAGLQKLGELPESSQRHLRDQLRGIIIDDEDGWSPEDAGTLYPFTPSSEAQGDAGLRAAEGEAWRELVANYHEREAAIYANAERSASATVPGTPGNGASGTGEPPGSAGGSGGASGSEQEQAAGGEPGSRADASTPAAAANGLNGQPAPQGRSGQEGVSQSALDYLTQATATPGQADAAGAGEAEGEAGEPAEASPGAESAPSNSDAAAQAAESAADASAQAQNAAAESANEPQTESDERPPLDVEYTSPGYIALKDLEQVRAVSGDTQADRGENGEDDD